MSISVQCPHCSARGQAPDDADGRKVSCRTCGKPFFVGLPMADMIGSSRASAGGAISAVRTIRLVGWGVCLALLVVLALIALASPPEEQERNCLRALAWGVLAYTIARSIDALCRTSGG